MPKRAPVAGGNEIRRFLSHQQQVRALLYSGERESCVEIPLFRDYEDLCAASSIRRIAHLAIAGRT